MLCHGRCRLERRLTMWLSDARLRRYKTKMICPDHRPLPWLTEDANPAVAQTDCQGEGLPYLAMYSAESARPVSRSEALSPAFNLSSDPLASLGMAASSW